MKHLIQGLATGEMSLRELRGISRQEMKTVLGVGQDLFEQGEDLAAAEVFAGLVMYDPLWPDSYAALGQILRRHGNFQAAKWLEQVVAFLNADSTKEGCVGCNR